MTTFAPWVLEIITFPVTVPDADGLKVMLMGVFCPAASVSGVVRPLTLKFALFVVICEMVRLVLPVLLIVRVFELELPAFRLVKPRLEGFADRASDGAVAVPESDNTLGELDALDATLTVPSRLPATVGANTTLNVALPPTGIVAGDAIPLTV
jgi:hypothetical protein